MFRKKSYKIKYADHTHFRWDQHHTKINLKRICLFSGYFSGYFAFGYITFLGKKIVTICAYGDDEIGFGRQLQLEILCISEVQYEGLEVGLHITNGFERFSAFPADREALILSCIF